MTAATAPYLRRDRSPLGARRLAPGELPVSLDAAYAGMAALTAAEPGRWGGWKLGGSNHASRAAFGVDRLYYGAIDCTEILDRPVRAPGFPLAELKGEVEIALRIAPGGVGYDAWCIALEMPSSPLLGLPGIGVAALVADRCAAGALLLGPVREGPLPDLSAARFAQEIDGTLQGESGIDALVAPPADLLADFRALAADHGAPVAAGHWVATGGITPCLPYRPGARVRIFHDGAAVIDTVIDTGPAEAG
jgi:2-keto-4-pentenoate hydratase